MPWDVMQESVGHLGLYYVYWPEKADTKTVNIISLEI